MSNSLQKKNIVILFSYFYYCLILINKVSIRFKIDDL